MYVFISEAEVWPRGRETETKKKSRDKGVSSTVFRQEPSYRVCVCVGACGRGMTEKKLTSSSDSGNELTKHISGGKMKEG